jgi:thioredoxin-related protein
MKKKTITRIIIFFVITAVGLSWVLTYQEYGKLNEIKQNYQTLPEFDFYSFDSDELIPAKFKEGMNTMILFFEPDCDYCLFELKALKKDIGKFKNTQIALISSASIDSLRQYKKQYDFSFIPNVNMYYADESQLINNFRNFIVPSIYIYNTNNELIEEFIGYTKMSELINSLESKNDKSSSH